MWIVFGLIAIGATLLNLLLFFTGKNYRLAMVMALAFTALTLVAQYNLVSEWVQAEDWAALEDVVPTMTGVLWILTLLSIIINVLPLVLTRKAA